MNQTTVSDEIWSILKETQKNLKELSVSQKETDQQIKKFSEELSVSQKETDQQIKKFSEELSASHKEAELEMKELRASQKELQASQKETDKQLKKTDARFNSQWGKLVESLVEGKLVEILNERGIEVRQTAQRVEVSYREKDGKIQRKEFDILAVNGTEIVVVEVKTTLRPSDVSYFLEALKGFKNYCPQYQSHAVYGAVAYLRSDAKAASYSEDKGLFVIRATGDSASIMNEKGFKPRVFS